MSVGGDGGLVPHMQLMDNLGVEWAALVDGPALEMRLPDYDGDAPAGSFEEVRAYWGRVHQVFTLASEFGTGERRGKGEIEAFMEAHNADAYEAAMKASKRAGARGKVNVGGVYAAGVPLPGEVSAIWREVVASLRN